MTTIRGVDVSSYQTGYKPTDGVDFVIVKATQGTGYANPARVNQVKAARAAGCVVGHYHFLEHGNAEAQAAWFVDRAVPRAGDLLVCDWEKKGCTSADKDSFIRKVQQLVPGCKVGLYCNTSWWRDANTKFYGDFLWIANYGKGHGVTDAPVSFWQYSQSGRWSGGDLDLNVGYFASLAEVAAWASSSATTPAPAPSKPQPSQDSPVIVFPKSDPKVPFRGGYTCSCVAFLIPIFEAECIRRGAAPAGWKVPAFQWGWRDDVAQSVGTHAKGMMSDLWLTDAQLAIAHELGLTHLRRTKAQGFTDEHYHGGPYGCTHGSAGANYQMSEWAATPQRNGLKLRGLVTPPVPVITWQQAVLTHITKLQEADDMGTWVRYVRTKDQKLPTGKWAVLKINDTDYVSFARGPAKINGFVNIQLTGLPAGRTLMVQPYWEDIDTAGKVTATGNYDWSEIQGSGGPSGQSIPIGMNPPKPGNGAKERRLRIRVATTVKNVTVTHATVGYWKGN